VSLLEKKGKTFKEAFARKIIAPEKLTQLLAPLQENGETIATLNGSFDLLHPGHLEMIYQASQVADKLILLLNTDASIQAYKSENRPINPLEVRLQQIAALEMVDFVSWFADTDPRGILEKIRPNIHVNGGDYGEDCLESEVVKAHGGKIHIVELIEGYSSTNLIEKIKSLCV